MKIKRILAWVLSLAMMITLLPTAALAEGTYTDPTVEDTGSGGSPEWRIFANGTALILTAGTGGTTETPYTVIYIDEDRDGEVDENTDTIWAPNNGDTTTAGNDLSSYEIYGGSNTGTVSSTKITMLGGLVGGSIYGGSYPSTDPTKAVVVSGDTQVTISGGTVRIRVSGGGYGSNSTVTGDTHVTISGNASVGGIRGGSAWQGTVNGNTYVTISGNARVESSVIGGGERGTVGGNTNINITGGTVINFVQGGDGNGGTVTGNAAVTISGGTVGSNIYGVSIYGGSKGGTVGGNATVTISGDAKVDGSIYGDDDNGETVTGTVSVIYPADKLGGAANTTYTVADNPVIDNTLGITCGTVTLAKDQSVTLNGKNYTAAEDNTKLNISNSVVSILAGSVVSDDDGEKPQLTAGEVSRASDSDATVKFTSNKAGTYYYSVVESGADAPTVDTSGEGTACDIAEQTITLSNLTAGAKDIYIVVKDEGGKISKVLKIEIPAYIVPDTTYTITFDTNGGSEIAPITLPHGATITAPSNPTKSGYTFKGWLDEEGNSVEIPETMPEENITLKASWKIKSSGGGGSSSTTTVTTKNDDGSTTKTTTNKATGTVTETTTNPDGSTTKVETKKDGTVTTTEKDKDGNTTTTVENPDGTSTTTEKTTDGTTTVTEKDADGTTITTETDKAGNKTVTTENTDGSTVTEETKKDGTKVVTETNSDGETSATVETKKETEVTIPVENADEVTKVVVTDENGVETEAEFTVTDGGVAIKVDGNVAVSVQTGHICYAKDFTDVDLAAWYHLNVDYVLENGLMKGTQADKFEPNANLTRAMLVTILYRAEGEPEMKNAQWFEDVEKGQWYSDAVAWATFNGITTGYGNGNFGPDDYITREQIAAIMHRYAKYKGYDVSVGENTNILSYSDFASVSEWAIADLQYAVGAGLIKGKTDSTLNPSDNATRAEAAAILERFIKAN